MPRYPFIAALGVALAAAILLAACGSDDAGGGSDEGTTVVATTTQAAEFARAVAGDRADVRQILQPNSDPHDYEPRPSDVRAASDATLVVRSGGDLDAWLDGILSNAGSGARTVTLINAVRADAPGDEPDPHWWHDPRNAIAAVQALRDALIAVDPPEREAYAVSADAYVEKLRALDTAIAGCMRSIPAARRKLVTDHDALQPYADRYGIEIVGTVIPARSTRAQPSAGEVARLVRTIRAAGVSTIFPERSVNPRLTRAIAADAGARVGPALYVDTLGPPGSAGETYIGALRFNTRALVEGFTGDPERCEV